jgi:sialic acid synthase SpsE
MVSFGKRPLGDGHPVFIVLEAGPTHSGLASAKKLTALAKEAGADAVKFQIVDPDRLVADRKMPFSYEVLAARKTGKMETVSEPLYDILMRRTLEREEWKELKKHCDGLGLAFFATVTFEDEVQLLQELKCDSIKIASGDVNHEPLLRLAARTGMCLQLDTGNSTLGEIEDAVDVIREEGNDNIIIHHCPSGYPARLEGINLNILRTLRQMFPYPVAFSDHTPGWEMDIAAVALGANLVEKTITEDRTTRSVEHIFSLEPQDMKAFVQAMRDLQVALGQPRRIMHAEEKKKRLNVRRSVHLKDAAKAGTRLGDAAVMFRRPGTGIPPDQFESLKAMKLRRDLPAGHRLGLSDLE